MAVKKLEVTKDIPGQDDTKMNNINSNNAMGNKQGKITSTESQNGPSSSSTNIAPTILHTT